MRVVLDANVLISALISPRAKPAEILRLWRQRRFDIVASPVTLEELKRVVYYPRIQERYQLPEAYVQQFLQLIRSQALVIESPQELCVVDEDPSDNRYLECAIAAGAEYIVSGDTHLLDLKEYQGIVILDPTGFLAVLAFEQRE